MPDPDILGPDAREDLLARVLAGELAIDEPTVQAAMRADAGFAEELRDLLALRDELAVAEAGPQAAEAATEEPWAGADEAMAALVEQELGSDRNSGRDSGAGPRPNLAERSTGPRHAGPRHSGGKRRSGSWQWGLVAVAAAAGLLVAISFWPDGGGSGTGGGSGPGGQLPNAPDTTRLGAFERWPEGTVARADFAQRGFEWGDLGQYAKADLTLSVFDASGTILVDEADVTGTSQFPPPAAVLDQPSLRWRLTASAPGRRDKSWPAAVNIQ